MSNSRSLVDIVNSTKLDEPILITPLVDGLLLLVSSFDVNNFYTFDKETKRMEGIKLMGSKLKIVYGRRLLAALFFWQNFISEGDHLYRSAAFAYDKTGKMAYALSKVDDEVEKPLWSLRSIIARSKSSELHYKMKSYHDAFYSYVYTASNGLTSLDYIRSNTVPGFSYERLVLSIRTAFQRAKSISEAGHISDSRILETYKSIAERVQVLVQDQNI